jgi:formate dehydrogenase major subunit
MVERFCGVPKERFLKIAEAYCSASGPEKTGAICYALGWTQQSKGPQIIRAAAILQLLLGNIGRPGGGILALRGHASIQGSTDIPTLYDILPGYLPMPQLGVDSRDLADYIAKHRDLTGWWWNFDKYIVSLLKAYYGEAANAENDWGFDWLPRVTGDHSHQGYFLEMMDGRVEGLFVMGQNPAVAGPNSSITSDCVLRSRHRDVAGDGAHTSIISAPTRVQSCVSYPGRMVLRLFCFVVSVGADVDCFVQFLPRSVDGLLCLAP